MTAIMGDQHNHSAPIVQLLLTVSFRPALENPSILALAEVHGLFRDEYPVFAQINRAGPMSIDPAERLASIGDLAGIPRLAFATEDTRHNIFFQNDRLSYGWSRTASLEQSSDYPGFGAMLATFRRHLDTLRKWGERFGWAVEPQVGEISYTDAFALRPPGTDQDRSIGDVFSFVRAGGLPSITNFNFAWSEPISVELPGFIETRASGPSLSPEGAPVMTLETTACMDASAGWERLDGPFNVAHLAIERIYERVIIPAARVTS